jgi:hypothetical protein
MTFPKFSWRMIMKGSVDVQFPLSRDAGATNKAWDRANINWEKGANSQVTE